MSDLFWLILRIAGYGVIGVLSLLLVGVGFILTIFGLGMLLFWRDDRRARKAERRDNDVLHERIQDYLRQQLTTQE